MPWPKISHIFETERPTNFKLGIRIDKNDPHRSMTCSWPQRSKVKVIRSRRQSDTCLPVTRQRKVAEILKLAGRLSMTRVTFSISSKVKRSRSPGRFIHRGVIASGSCRDECGNVLSVRTYCYVAVCRRGRLGGARRFGAHRERRGAGHIVAAARLQLVSFFFRPKFVFELLRSCHVWRSTVDTFQWPSRRKFSARTASARGHAPRDQTLCFPIQHDTEIDVHCTVTKASIAFQLLFISSCRLFRWDIYTPFNIPWHLPVLELHPWLSRVMAPHKGVYNSRHSQKQLLFVRRSQLEDLKCKTTICRPRARTPGENLQHSPDPWRGADNSTAGLGPSDIATSIPPLNFFMAPQFRFLTLEQSISVSSLPR